MPATLLNYYRLPGVAVIGCEYPHHPEDASVAKAKRKILETLGVTHIVDLTEPDELVPWSALDGEWQPTRERFSIRDVSIPTSLAAFDRLITSIMTRIGAGDTIAVHCWGGVGRTGMVTAAILVRAGWGVDDALAEVNRLWRATPKASLAPHRQRTAPETTEQCEFVRSWARTVRDRPVQTP
jgi:protein-tyrosine phosphatase